MSDGYFDSFDEFDSAFLNEVDEIEASQLNPPKPFAEAPLPLRNEPPDTQPTWSKDTASDDYDMSFNVDVNELERLDEFIADSYAGKAKPVAGPSLTRQTTLDGKILPIETSNQARSFNRTKSSGNSPFEKGQKTKKWDNTAFAQTGWISTKGKGKDKGKGRAKNDVEEGEEDDEDIDGIELEFEQFPAPFMSIGYPSPMKLKPDPLAARTWIYPLNRPRRDYQFNIAKKCLFQNTLVALPTGLGKTYIAGVVMLNYYKWFPEGRIVFLAPTKPLVAQQIEACHQVCGIAGSDAAELNGDVHRSKRAAAWAEKRVLYMTPQTLVNDFISGIADPQDIVLIVIDEAHKGTGDYAYAQVVRYMMAKNPYHRILALSATPGNKPEAVQAIVDSLHISHIEIRNEESQDLYKYSHKKTVELHIIKMTDTYQKLSTLLSKVIEPFLNRVRGCGLVYTESPIMLRAFVCVNANQDVFKKKDPSLKKWAFGYLKVLGHLARAMGYLIEMSMRSCYRELVDMQEKINTGGKPSDKIALKKIMEDKNWVDLMSELERQKVHGFDPHPKLEKLVSLALKHFVETDADAAVARERGEVANGSRVMIFVQFRDAVDEVMDQLKLHHPLIRPAPFIGQGTDKRGKKGISQKEQLQTIQKFKDGEFNVLISTSIGEEGLDIGEVDKIICYDAQKSSIRMLQRVGRTGRKREGSVDVLLAEHREEKNWKHSKDNYEDVQDVIIRGSQLTLFDDVERLVPGVPECLLTEMPIEPYIRSPRKEKKTKEAPVKKRKRNDDINRNIPLGATTGFVTASELRPKTNRKTTTKSIGRNDLDSDSDDAAIAAGLDGISPPPVKKSRAKGANKNGGKAGKSKSKSKASSQANLDSFLVPEHLEEDDDDVDIQAGLDIFTDSPMKHPLKVVGFADTKSKPVRPARTQRKHMILSDDDGDSPPAETTGRRKKSAFSKSARNLQIDSPSTAEPSAKSDRNWLLQNSSDLDAEEPPSINKTLGPRVKKPSGKSKISSFESARSHLRRANQVESEPDSPSCVENNLSIPSDESSATFAVRAPIKGRRVQLPPSSPPEGDAMPPPRRLVRRRSPSPVARPAVAQRLKRRKTKILANPALFDTEAIHSGDDVSEGMSDVDLVESEGDRQFLQEPGMTQLTPSYNQTAAYRIGLMTQVPDNIDGPKFAKKPKRVGRFAGGRTQVPTFNSSPQRSGELDEYHIGSFVVDDDEPILCSNSSEP